MVVLKWESIVILLVKLKITWCLIKLNNPYEKMILENFSTYMLKQKN